MELTFFQWLAEQKDRHDPIGKLARNLIYYADGLRINIEQLELIDSCEQTINAFNSAVDEYQIYYHDNSKEK